MSNVIITADSSMLVVDAAKLMSAEAIGSLIVTKEDILVGLVTRSSMISAQLLSDEVYHSLKLEDIMETPVVTINPDADLGQIITLMDQCGCKHIPVIEGEDIIGIVTATDIIGVLATMKLIAQGASET
jgi:CBS domain-containing protein